MTQILIRTIEGASLFIDRDELTQDLVSSLKKHLESHLGILATDFFLEQENRVLLDLQSLTSLPASEIYMKIRLNGGKGGFGSLLRGQAPKKKYTNNFSSCRDLSGRRLRQVDNEKKYAEWKAKKEEEEQFIEREQKEYESKKKVLQQAIYANKYKIDDKYKKQLQKSSKSIADGVMKGISKHKRKAPEKSKLDDDILAGLEEEPIKKAKEDININKEERKQIS